jgi:hypothetical protein
MAIRVLAEKCRPAKFRNIAAQIAFLRLLAELHYYGSSFSRTAGAHGLPVNRLLFIQRGIVYTDFMATSENPPKAETAKKDEKPKKDAWDKADILLKALITFAVALIGWRIEIAVSTQNTGKDYMQIALNILEKKDLTADMQKNKGLRKWAVDLLQYYSPEKLDQPTAIQLAKGEVEIPLVDFNAPGQKFDLLQLTARAAHGGPFASVNTDGVLTVSHPSGQYTDQTGIKSPKLPFFRTTELK